MASHERFLAFTSRSTECDEDVRHAEEPYSLEQVGKRNAVKRRIALSRPLFCRPPINLPSFASEWPSCD